MQDGNHIGAGRAGGVKKRDMNGGSKSKENRVLRLLPLGSGFA
jgi:hypothetical protein